MNAANSPRQLSLSVFVNFKAAHSLSGFETPHFHLWKLAIEFSTQAPFEGDRLIDLVYLQKKVHEIVAPIENKFLNPIFGFQPTSENMAQWLWKQVNDSLSSANEHARLSGVSVTLCDLEGEAMGAARLS
jgi:6-pyruvoyl-tetrahydropterin synthase